MSFGLNELSINYTTGIRYGCIMHKILVARLRKRGRQSEAISNYLI